MSKSAMIRARIEPELKAKVEAILKELGLSPTEAITLYYQQIALNNGIPFSVHIPNAGLRKTIRDARAGKGLKSYESVEALIKDLMS